MRDHEIRGEGYLECAICGQPRRRYTVRELDGLRVCRKCRWIGDYKQSSWIGWPSGYKGNQEYGVMVFRGEWGYQQVDGEYGVLTGFNGIRASISGQYGTVIATPDFKVDTGYRPFPYTAVATLISDEARKIVLEDGTYLLMEDGTLILTEG